MRNFVWLFLVAMYLVVRFGMTQWLDGLGQYASYELEAVLVIAGFFLYGSQSRALWSLNKFIVGWAMTALSLGFAVYKLSGMMHIPIPFDLSAREMVIFLLVVAPILEEAVFRFFIWQPLQKSMGAKVAYVLTVLLFSYSHFHSVWFVPAEIHPFITYQTVYTLFLAAICGWSIWRYNSLLGAMLIHFGFNLGFYLGVTF
jgi:membrane protease YdiL (CAAX protease family)